MKNLILFIFTAFILFSTSSCKMTQRAINEGNFEYAINRNVDKLRKNKKKQRPILELEDAYKKANLQDFSTISYLKSEGNPANYVRIYDLYDQLADRQRKVEPLLPLYIKKEARNANIELKDYTANIIQYKNKAAEYLYAKAQQLLKTGHKYDARQAYSLLEKLEDFYPNFRDIRSQLARANTIGSNRILFELDNKSGMLLPANFEEELHKISLNELDQLWADFHVKPIPGMQYDYKVKMNVNVVDVSPERITERIYTQEKRIEDGWEYVLNQKGNVAKDSLGNDIKRTVYANVFCDIIELNQTKEAHISGTVDFVDLKTNQIIGHYPVSVTNTFNNQHAQVRGDKRAMDKHAKRLLQNQPLPFPSDMAMLIDASRKLKPAIKDIIYDNEDLVLN